VRTILRYIKIYFMIMPQYVKTRMQYRADFFVGILGILASNCANIVILWLVFSTIPSLGGWSYHELLFFYGFFILALTPQQLFFDFFWFLGPQLQDGSFIRYYFRPLNMLFYYTSWHFDLKGLAQLLFGSCILVYAGLHMSIAWTLPTVLLLVVNWFSASLIMIAIVVAGMSTAFWIINPNSLTMTLTTVRDFARYPLDIFNKLFRALFTFVAPIGFISFYPCAILLRPAVDVPMAAWFTPAVGAVMFLLAYQVWKKGVNSYSGTGS
jgi:ABC-2 type transport system permease protein